MKSDKELFEANKEDVYKLCRLMSSSQSDAEDICQEVFVKALGQDRSRITEEKAWLLRIAANLCRNQYSRRKRGLQKELLSYFLRKPALPLQPDDQVIRREQQDEFVKWLEELPIKLRAALSLRYGNGLSLEETAKVLDIPLGTVKSRIHKGLAVLRGRIEAEERYNRKGENCYDAFSGKEA
ncbi:RNA polymerase sigma factor [Paenibacillus sp. PL2-23]|uniref:RNA polymerase sigma factor n=1 Tax=Paenibacillus sp. PL2-23 TaxID=2100729 RepID=UPI0030F78041